MATLKHFTAENARDAEERQEEGFSCLFSALFAFSAVKSNCGGRI